MCLGILCWFCIWKIKALLQPLLVDFIWETLYLGLAYFWGFNQSYKNILVSCFFFSLITEFLSSYVFSWSYNLPEWLLEISFISLKVILQLNLWFLPWPQTIICFLHTLSVYWSLLLSLYLGICVRSWLQWLKKCEFNIWGIGSAHRLGGLEPPVKIPRGPWVRVSCYSFFLLAIEKCNPFILNVTNNIKSLTSTILLFFFSMLYTFILFLKFFFIDFFYNWFFSSVLSAMACQKVLWPIPVLINALE